MKKVSFVFSLVLISTLLLAACGGGNNGMSGTPGALGTPDTLSTSDTGVIPSTGTTPTTDMGVVETTPATLATAQPPLATATTSTDTGAITSTPEMDVDFSQSPDRLSALLAYDVRNSAGVVIGQVNGVLVNRNKIVTEAAVDDDKSGSDMTTTSTPAAGSVAATSAPATGTGSTGSTDTTTMSTAQGGAQITYLVVELNMAYGETSGTTGDAAGSTRTTSTPMAGATQTTGTDTGTGMTDDNTGMLGAGDEVLLPFSAFEPVMVGVAPMAGSDSDNPALTLTIDDQILAGAPVFDRDSLDFMVATWDEQFQSYWSGQGLGIPVTGEMEDTTAGFETVLLGENFEGINVVNTNRDDLGEVEDFILDTQTGKFTYAVLATGGFLGLGERWIPVPMAMVAWMVSDDMLDDSSEREIDDVGEILINVPEDAFENAPSFEGLNMLDTSVATWDTDITSFWMTYGPNSTTP